MTTTVLPVAPVAPTRRRTGAILTVLLTAQLMAILDVNIVNVAAATIRVDLHATGPTLQLIIAGYLIAYAVLLITGARVGGTAGFRRVFLAGLGVFTAASLACALATGPVALIGFRFLQGAGAAFMIPQVFSLIQRHFEGPARARALGRYAAVIAGGVVLGQILGGVLVSADLFGTGWRPIFMINVPVGIALLVFAARVLPRDGAGSVGSTHPADGAGLVGSTHPADGARSPRRHDLPGLVTLGVSVLALVVPLLFGREYGWPAWCWALIAGSVALFAVFAAVQRRVAAPLMPARLFRARGLRPAVVALFAMMASYAGYLFSVALHLQAGLGWSPLRAGLAFVPMALCFGLSSLHWRRLPAAWHRHLITVGLAVATLALAAIALTFRSATPGVWFYLAQVPFGLGAGVAFSPLMGRALANVAPADAPDASGLVTTIVQLAQVVGLSTVGSVYLSVAASHGSPAAVAVTTGIEAALALVATAVAVKC